MHQEGRISIRLKDYDYTQGAYFLTLCTVRHVCLFASVNDGKLRLNRLGRIVAQEWRRTGELRPEVFLDAWALMPNHLHAIVFLPDKEPVPAEAGTGGAHGPFDKLRAGVRPSAGAREALDLSWQGSRRRPQPGSTRSEGLPAIPSGKEDISTE